MAFVQKTSASTNGSSPSQSLTGVTAGNTLALLSSTLSSTDSTPTDSSGQTWSKAVFTALSGVSCAVYYLLNANAGTHTLTWGAGNAGSFIGSTLVEFPPCSAVDIVGTVASATGNPTTISASITTVAASTVIFGVYTLDPTNGSASSAITDPPTGFTSLYVQQQTNTYEGTEHCYREVAAASTYTATWTMVADGNAQIARAILVSFVKSGGVNSFSYTPTGGIAFSGAATKLRGRVKTAAGGLTFAGAATQTRKKVEPTPSGGPVFSGSAAQTRGHIITPTGGLTLSGAATILRGLVRTATGGIIFSGSAPVSFHSAVQQLIVTPVGGFVLAGSAAVVRSARYIAAGGITFGGAANVVFNGIITTASFIRRGLRRRH